MRSTGNIAMRRDGSPSSTTTTPRHVLMSGSEPGCIVVDGKGAIMSPHLSIELAARGRSVIPVDALHVPRPPR